MNKKKFLEELENELVQNHCADVSNILEYYDEFIEDKKESGKKEKDIITNLDIQEIIKNIKIEQKIDAAIEKPTVSNSIKATIAFLSVLSLPLLIPFGAIIFAVAVTVVALLFSLFVTVAAIIFSAGASIVALIYAVFTGKLGLATAMFSIGAALILIGLFSALFKWVIKVSKEFISWFTNELKTRFNKRKEVNHD